MGTRVAAPGATSCVWGEGGSTKLAATTRADNCTSVIGTVAVRASLGMELSSYAMSNSMHLYKKWRLPAAVYQGSPGKDLVKLYAVLSC